MWSKHDDITIFLDYYKYNLANIDLTSLQNPTVDIISFDDLYQLYKNYINAKSIVDQKVNLIVSKQFFEKYITNQLSEFIKFEKFVSSEWLTQ